MVPISSSVVTVVTTNPAGSTVTTLRDTIVTLPPSSNPPPPPPATSVVVRTTTNPQGSVIVASSTSTAPDTSSTGACSGGSYTDNLGYQWIIQCQTAYYYSDLVTVTVASFEACLEACDQYTPSPNVARGASCIAVTYGPRTSGGECYRKFNVTDSRFDRREDSAYKVGQSVVPPPASTIGNTNVASFGANTASGSTGNVQPTSAGIPASSNPNLSTSRPYTPPADNTNVPTTTDLGAPATLIGSSTTTAASINPTLAYQPCPLSDNQQWTDSLGYVYDIKCGCDLQYSDLIAPHYDTFRDCILACDNYQPDPNVARGAPCVGAVTQISALLSSTPTLSPAMSSVPRESGQLQVPPRSYQSRQPPHPRQAPHPHHLVQTVDAASPNSVTRRATLMASMVAVALNMATVAGVTLTVVEVAFGGAAVVEEEALHLLQLLLFRRSHPRQDGRCGLAEFGYVTCDPNGQYGCLNGCSNPGVAPSSSSSPAVVPSSSSSTRSPVVTPPSSSPPRSDGRCGLADFGYATCDPNGQYGCLNGCNNPGVAPSSSSSSAPLAVTSSTSTGVNPANTFAPPELSGSVRCPANNGSIYTDGVGQRWEVRCGQNIRGTNAKAVHADSWEKCLEFCSILGSVVGVTYPGGGFDNTNAQSINCYPYNVFQEFTSGAVPTLVAARPLNISTGNYFNQDTLCPGYDNETYTDYYGRVYEIRCDHAYGGGTNLAPTITKSLEGCLSFCSTYNTCVGVSFTQYIVGSRTDNCFPKSLLGDFTYQAGNSSAQLITR
ncbi:MAG: hypothetical protein Q9200_005438 [Gallowayella weberi]